jgi:hypothetical protein
MTIKKIKFTDLISREQQLIYTPVTTRSQQFFLHSLLPGQFQELYFTRERESVRWAIFTAPDLDCAMRENFAFWELRPDLEWHSE